MANNAVIEIRLRPMHCLIILITVLLVIFMFSNQNGDKTLLTRRKKLPIIYAITPTYARRTQEPNLIRISHILKLVPNLYWILVEDSNATTPFVRSFLRRKGLTNRSTQLYAETPLKYKSPKSNPQKYARGVVQRNEGLSWIRANINAEKHSIVFFMDDDNTYSLELFAEMNKIEKGRVGVWPVGLAGGLWVEKPVVNRAGTQVVGFNAIWRPDRRFPIDMAGFAISTVLFFKNPQAKFSYNVVAGDQESTILRQVTTVRELQPLANKCRDVLVWHTRTT